MAHAFISYTHSDEDLKDQFLHHLAPLRREGLIEVWHDRMLRAGEHLDAKIQAEVASSELIILLVSAPFLASEYCYEEEMRRAFARQRSGSAAVVTLILKPCQWKNVPVGEGLRLSDFLAVPKDGKPVTQWRDPDEAFDDAVGSIRKLLVGSHPAAMPRESVPAQPARPHETAPVAPGYVIDGGFGATGLVQPRVTDRDRHRFIRDAFERAAQSFEGQLRHLSADEPRIETEFERVDSRSFVATVYADGNKAGECRVFTGDAIFGDSICLSFDASSRGGMNEWLIVNPDRKGLSFKASNLSGYGREKNEILDEAGAADYLWDTFLKHVKSRLR